MRAIPCAPQRQRRASAALQVDVAAAKLRAPAPAPRSHVAFERYSPRVAALDNIESALDDFTFLLEKELHMPAHVRLSQGSLERIPGGRRLWRQLLFGYIEHAVIIATAYLYAHKQAAAALQTMLEKAEEMDHRREWPSAASLTFFFYAIYSFEGWMEAVFAGVISASLVPWASLILGTDAGGAPVLHDRRACRLAKRRDSVQAHRWTQ